MALHLAGNLLAAVDIETTGLLAGQHDILQIAIVPATPDLQPDFKLARQWFIAPTRLDFVSPEAMRVNGLSLEDLTFTAPSVGTVTDHIVEYLGSLPLPVNKGLIPLAHNWAFESAFLSSWLGLDGLSTIFSRRARDTMTLAAGIFDSREFAGDTFNFPSLSLEHLCQQLGITNERPHDAFYDCCATIHLYRRLLEIAAHPEWPVESILLSPEAA
jgi:DNA polymerase III epsilon subunit-like protein